MKKFILYILLFFAALNSNAQVPGDTIKVKAFKYGSATRDTVINFPNNSLTYEKIILKYNMRCKNALISTQSAPNQGCGEWDYSCNTYIVDSSKIENSLNLQPSHVISNFSGTTFNYVSQPIYDYYNYSQNNVVLNNIVSENQYTVGAGTSSIPNLLKSDEKSGKSQILYTAAELTSAGFVAGNIDGILLNVANAGGTVNFFKVGIQHSAANTLNSSTVAVSGFTNVFNSNYSFATGSNRIQFHTPFVWNGTSNVLIEFSFTNTQPSTPIVFSGAATSSTMALYTKNNYALNLSSFGHVPLNTSLFSTINNEITVSFWVFGDASQLPTNTALLEGYSAIPNARNLNLHMPWGDNNIYFDCGNSSNSYDRINKVATAAEQGGQWNHWAFTKNATTGNMKIYLNGLLWSSGTGKTKPISIVNLILGKSQSFTNNYKGKINELSIWDKELSLADIQTWMNKPIDASHPFYGNLIGYYKMNEGNGLNITDSKNNLVSAGVNLQWTYDAGNNLSRMFSETNLRPNIVFLNGNYALTTTSVITKDSVARNPNVVQQYSITSNATVTPMAHDVVALVSTTNLYEALPQKVYDGNTNVLTGTIAVVPTGVINITNLNYYRRFPFYNEIMSFVTPYGKGLDLGPNGKTWYYDLTDYTPILKGPKRLMMSLGGQNQEQMDLDFLFIVGTPPRNVLEFNQLWQGAARDGAAAIASITNDTRFNTLNVPMHVNGQAFKVRSTITGHGAQGEFHQNGGLINHYFNVGGGPNEFSWQITQECSTNPIFPQGGTWLYDRQGWCPGETSLTKELNVTPFVTPGSTVTLDYNCSNAPSPTGDYRYIVANQLITYGAANHSNDASIIDVLKPSNKVLYSRNNPICSNPVILVQNTGSNVLTSLDIDYWVNNTTTKQTFNWTGNLAFMDTTRIVLPINSLWLSGIQTSNNKFNVELKKANGVVDDYSFNNVYSSPFVVPGVVPSHFSIEFKTNNYPTHNTYKIIDEAGNIVGSSNFTDPNTIYEDYYILYGCYKLIVEDTGGDGLSWWANTAQGSGYVRLKDNWNVVIKTFQPDFGSRFEYSFTIDSPLSLNKNNLDAALNLYPNPSHNKFILDGNELEGAEINCTNILGQTVTIPFIKSENKMDFNTTNTIPGVYFITITKNGNTATKKVIIY
ncbi:MAG: LamG-like jellyroll fold domain-containing protein [Bacteroidota bacterium]|nr:LamG-like jellyroll fold domain-containing protein [Bacteroidota bacterium]MDP3147045.1 LamG-like jellyroll fold domain-containing protein [Bacteroidota bacterium]